jgi:hypothetical protein
MDKQIEQLKQAGIAKGLCRLWQMKLKEGMSIEDQAKLYIKGIDFCIGKDYPTLDYLREHYRGHCEPYGVYVDDEIQGLRNVPDVVLNGDCKAMLEYDEYSVSRLYIRHGSQASVNVSDHAVLTIDVFDNSYLAVAAAGGNAQVIVNKYGNAQVYCIGSGITIRNTNKKTY